MFLQVWQNYREKSRKMLEEGIKTEKADEVTHPSNLSQHWIPAATRQVKRAQSLLHWSQKSGWTQRQWSEWYGALSAPATASLMPACTSSPAASMPAGILRTHSSEEQNLCFQLFPTAHSHRAFQDRCLTVVTSFYFYCQLSLQKSREIGWGSQNPSNTYVPYGWSRDSHGGNPSFLETD